MNETILYCYIRYGGVEANKFSTSIVAKNSVWDTKKQLFTGYSETTVQANSEINRIQQDVRQIYERLRYEKVQICASLIRDMYLKQRNTSFVSHNFVKLYGEYIDNTIREKQALGCKGSTLKKWEYSKNYIQSFVSSERHNSYDVRDISLLDAKDYYNYLRKTKSERLKTYLSVSHCRRHTQYLRSFLSWCVEQKYIAENPILYWLPSEKLRRMLTISLSYQECMMLYHAVDLTQTERHVVDIFTFLAFTSLDFGDYQTAHTAKIKSILIDGKHVKYFDWVRNKTRIDVEPSNCVIVLLPIAELLLQKYSYGFPPYTNQTINKVLKRVATRLGIDNASKLTSKTARKSFATMLLNDGGVRYEVLKEIIGHESVTTTERHYAQVKTRTVLAETSHLAALFSQMECRYKQSAGGSI